MTALQMVRIMSLAVTCVHVFTSTYITDVATSCATIGENVVHSVCCWFDRACAKGCNGMVVNGLYHLPIFWLVMLKVHKSAVKRRWRGLFCGRTLDFALFEEANVFD